MHRYIDACMQARDAIEHYLFKTALMSDNITLDPDRVSH